MSLIIGKTYTRQQIARILGIPPEFSAGDFTTGYSQPLKKHSGDKSIVIFANVDSCDPLGINYHNVWESNGNLTWSGKKRSQLSNNMIRDMISGDNKVMVFTRSGERDPWFYNGLATPVDIQDETPVIIEWSFDKDAVSARLDDESAPRPNENEKAFNFLYIASATTIGTEEILPMQKIGIAKHTLDKRIRQLNSTKMPIKVSRVVGYNFQFCDTDARAIETKLHNMLEKYRVNGEWFSNEDVDIEELVEKACRASGAFRIQEK